MPELLRLEINVSDNISGSANSSWTLMGVCNWDEYPKRHCVPVSQLSTSAAKQMAKKRRPIRIHVFNFFKQSYNCIDGIAPLVKLDVIPSHSADLLAIRGEV